MSSTSMSLNYPMCRWDLNAKHFTCYKGSNRGEEFYGCVNFILNEKPGCGFFQWFPEDESLKMTIEMEDNLSLRVERIERDCK